MGASTTTTYTCDKCGASSSAPTNWLKVTTAPATGGPPKVKYVCSTHAAAVTAALTQ